MTLGQKLKREAVKAREALAAAEFSAEAVTAACKARASEGFTFCEIRPSRPLDVHATATAKATAAALVSERLRVEWEKVHDKPAEPAYYVLRVSWDQAEPDA